MRLDDHAFEALREAAEAGASFDDLRLDRTDDGYVVETPRGTEAGLSADELRKALEAIDEYATNWRYWRETVGGEGTARRAFLRWCERAPLLDRTESGSAGEPASDAELANVGTADTGTADAGIADARILPVPERYEALREGIDREWGQLAITVRFADADEPGERVYDLRHVADADIEVADLAASEDPRDAREIATYDEDGRYRPLKTAPTLPRGWVFAGLSGRELVEAVDVFYPATVANWHRERRGELDVDHWLETAERQTGIYDVVDELPRQAVEWMAEACCVDSQCLRRREWQYAEGDALGVDGGDGPFPCREPCSLVIAAARTWAILESEEERTWQLELTTSELNQFAELLDAVADDRLGEIREADVGDGANRYRARYLRAKRLDDDGSLRAKRVDES